MLFQTWFFSLFYSERSCTECHFFRYNVIEWGMDLSSSIIIKKHHEIIINVVQSFLKPFYVQEEQTKIPKSYYWLMIISSGSNFERIIQTGFLYWINIKKKDKYFFFRYMTFLLLPWTCHRQLGQMNETKKKFKEIFPPKMSSFIHPHVNLKTDSFFCRTQEDILKNVSIVFVMLEVTYNESQWSSMLFVFQCSSKYLRSAEDRNAWNVMSVSKY